MVVCLTNELFARRRVPGVQTWSSSLYESGLQNVPTLVFSATATPSLLDQLRVWIQYSLIH